MRHPFRYFNSLPEVIRLMVMMSIRYPLSLRQVEDLLFEQGIDVRPVWRDRQFVVRTRHLFAARLLEGGYDNRGD